MAIDAFLIATRTLVVRTIVDWPYSFRERDIRSPTTNRLLVFEQVHPVRWSWTSSSTACPCLVLITTAAFDKLIVCTNPAIRNSHAVTSDIHSIKDALIQHVFSRFTSVVEFRHFKFHEW